MNSTITLPRAELQAALDALENRHKIPFATHDFNCKSAADALRARLAEPTDAPASPVVPDGLQLSLERIDTKLSGALCAFGHAETRMFAKEARDIVTAMLAAAPLAVKEQ